MQKTPGTFWSWITAPAWSFEATVAVPAVLSYWTCAVRVLVEVAAVDVHQVQRGVEREQPDRAGHLRCTSCWNVLVAIGPVIGSWAIVSGVGEPVDEHLVLQRAVVVRRQELDVLDPVVPDEVQDLRCARRRSPPSGRTAARTNCWIASSLITILCFAVEFSRSFLNFAFWTGPSIVRAGSLIAVEAAGRRVRGQEQAERERRPTARSAASARGRPPQTAATSASRQERSSMMNSSTSLAPLDLAVQRVARARRVVQEARLADRHPLEERLPAGRVAGRVDGLAVVVVEDLVVVHQRVGRRRLQQRRSAPGRCDPPRRCRGTRPAWSPGRSAGGSSPSRSCRRGRRRSRRSPRGRGPAPPSC